MDFKKLLELLEKGEGIANPFSGIIGSASGILNMLGVGRKRQIRQQKEMVENAAKINYKFDIRTDRFEVAIDAIDKINQSAANHIVTGKQIGRAHV